jgi:hypothetical protein
MKISLILFLIAIVQISCTQPGDPSVQKKIKQDSIAYFHKAIDFINQVALKGHQDSTFKLCDRVPTLASECRLEEIICDTATFTASEIEFIKCKDSSNLPNWNKNQFPNIKIIPWELISAAAKKNNGWSSLSTEIGRFHTFSYPVFLRNFTYCLFYSSVYCGFLCGEGSLVLYKYEGGKWREVKTYCHWVS